MSRYTLQALVRYTVWANGEWVALIEHNRGAGEALRHTMSHILLGEYAWFERIEGHDPHQNVWHHLDGGALREMYARHQAHYRELLDAELDRIIEFVRFTGERGRASVADVLLHLVLHGAHHRGQLSRYATTYGIAPPATDYIQFCLVSGPGGA